MVFSYCGVSKVPYTFNNVKHYFITLKHVYVYFANLLDQVICILNLLISIGHDRIVMVKPLKNFLSFMAVSLH